MKLETTNEVHFGQLFKGLKKLCGNDPLRPVFRGAHIINGYIIATDAHHLVKIDLVKFFGISKELVNQLNGKFIPIEILTELERITKKEFVRIDSKGFHTHYKSMLFRDNDFKIPDFDKVIEDDVKKESIDTFNIRGHYLVNIQNIYTNEGLLIESLTINTFGPHKNLKIQNKDKSFVGIIMPLNIN